MKRTYVPTTLDQYVNESKSITLKRGYKGQSPVVVGANAPIRNQILAYVAEGVRVGASDLKKFIAGLNETNANPNAAANMWLRRNGKFFISESKGGKTYFKLSTLGQRLVNSFSAPNQVSESEKAKLQEKKKYDFKDPKTGDPGIVDDEEEDVEESCSKKTHESVDPGKKAKANLGGKLDPKLHNLLTKDQDKDEGELDGFEKEISEEKKGISPERKARIEAIIENIKARQKSALNEDYSRSILFIGDPMEAKRRYPNHTVVNLATMAPDDFSIPVLHKGGKVEDIPNSKLAGGNILFINADRAYPEVLNPLIKIVDKRDDIIIQTMDSESLPNALQNRLRITESLNEDEKEKDEKEKETEETEAGSEDELSFDDLDLSGEGDDVEGEETEGEEAEGEEAEGEGEEEEADGEEDDVDDEDEGEEEKVEITEFILTVDDVDSALSELEELGVDAEKVVDPEGEPGEGEEEAYKDDEISVDAEDWDKLKGWLEDKGVDVEEMFGGEIEVEDVDDEELEGEEDMEDLDIELDVDSEEGEEGEEGEEDIDLDMDLDLDVEGAEDLEIEEEEPEVEESLTGMENHVDDTNNLIKGAKTVIIKYDR